MRLSVGDVPPAPRTANIVADTPCLALPRSAPSSILRCADTDRTRRLACSAAVPQVLATQLCAKLDLIGLLPTTAADEVDEPDGASSYWDCCASSLPQLCQHC